MKHIAFILLAWLSYQAGQDTYVCKNAKISIFSKAPLEDINAASNKGTSVFNAATSEIAFNVPVRSLQFQKSLMQEHFNENYMESDKYPNASFKGQIQEKFDYSKNGAQSNAPASFSAVQVACTHQGTPVNYNTAQGVFICPNHGSKFSTTGAVLLGPAATALKQYALGSNGKYFNCFSLSF